jgi:PPOX class probable F420-dependent enzyme
MQLEGAAEAEISFLLSARVARLATTDRTGRPHAVPVCFALAGGRIYTPLDEKPKRVHDSALQRVRNILANPTVCLLVDRYSEDWTELAWLQVRGRAELIEPDSEFHQRALDALRDRYPQYRLMALESRPVLQLTPERIVSWRVNG